MMLSRLVHLLHVSTYCYRVVPKLPMMSIAVHVVVIAVVSIMMQGNAVKLLERIHNLPARRIQTRVQRYALHLAGGNPKAFV